MARGVRQTAFETPGDANCLAGNFNQRIPLHRGPRSGSIGEALLQAFEGLEIATKGDLEGAPRPSIDHIAHSADLAPRGVTVWSDRHADGTLVSDQLGVLSDFSLQ